MARSIALRKTEIKKGSTVKTVLPVRFAAFQLLLLLPAHPWQLFLWPCGQSFILNYCFLLTPPRCDTSSWSVPGLPDPPNHPDRFSFSILEVSFNASCVILFASSRSLSLKHHPGVSFRSVIILMFTSLSDSLSTKIESSFSRSLTRRLQTMP